ncbi:MAG: hypothetical protein P8Y07_12450 [Gemmatimonadales bacterium]|jgi:hypothetical protein
MIQPEFEPLATPRTEQKDAELAREGWIRRFVGGPPRLLEIREVYETLGHEVRLETLSPEELAEECGDCRLALELFRVVYTRRKVDVIREAPLEHEAEEEAAQQVSGNPRRSK